MATSMQQSEKHPVALWLKVLAWISLALLAASVVWSFVESGFGGQTLYNSALFMLFLGILYVNILSRPTKTSAGRE